MNTKLLQNFNSFINHEFYSAYLYFAMSTYFLEIAMFGFCDFMKHKASEKLNVAQKFYNYLILRDEKLTFSKIEEPNADWINVSDVFSVALSHEEFILTKINDLYNIAKEENDFATCEFVADYLNNQTRNVGNLRKIIFRIKNSNIVSTNVEIIDSILDRMNLN